MDFLISKAHPVTDTHRLIRGKIDLAKRCNDQAIFFFLRVVGSQMIFVIIALFSNESRNRNI